MDGKQAAVVLVPHDSAEQILREFRTTFADYPFTIDYCVVSVVKGTRETIEKFRKGRHRNAPSAFKRRTVFRLRLPHCRRRTTLEEACKERLNN